MIRNYQRSSSDSNVDLSPIYNSLQTINALLYRLDVQTTIPNAINSISNSVINIENKVDNITKDDYSLAYYITDSVLTKPLYQYNNYSTLQSTAPIIVFEPYVQSVTRTSNLEGRYWFAYNLPNATLQYTNESLPLHATNGIEYEGLTCAKLEADYFGGSSYVIGTYMLNGALLTRCSGQYLEAQYCKLYDCNIHQIKINASTIYAVISNCILNNVSITKVGLSYCLGIWVSGVSNTFNGCTLASYPTYANSYRIMNLNRVGNMKNCSFASCELNCSKNINSSYSFENCSFNNASIYHLTHTRFMDCSGNVYIPKLINGVNMFDDNNNYIGQYITSYSTTIDTVTLLPTSSLYETTFTHDITTDSIYTDYSYDTYTKTYSSMIEETLTLTTSYDPVFTYTTTSGTYETYEFTSINNGEVVTETALTPIDTITITESIETSSYTSFNQYTQSFNSTQMYTYETWYESTITITTNGSTETAAIATPIETLTSTGDVTYLEPDIYETLTLTSTYTTTVTEYYSDIHDFSSYVDTNISTEFTYNNSLTYNILPEWKTPNIFTNNGIANQYINTYVNINHYTRSMDRFEVNDCEGNVEMYISSLNNDFVIKSNELYKFKINVNNLNSLFMFSLNTIRDGEILIDAMDGGNMFFDDNKFDKLNMYYNLTQNQSIVAANNEFNILNIQAGAMGNLRMSNCNINNGVLYGWNGLYSCTANYIENYGENSYSKNSINTLRAHNIKLMYDNTISKLIIEPNDYKNFSFMGNSIGTIVCPSYFNINASTAMNIIGTIIPY